MEPKLTQTQTQKMILAPQMRQFLKLLELPIYELEQKIQQEIEQNPTLEEPESVPETDTIAQDDERDKAAEDTQIRDILEEMASYQNSRKLNDFNRDLSFVDHDEIQKRRDYQEGIQTKPLTLYDYLQWQLSMIDLTPEEKIVAEEIIGNINDDGQLVTSIEEIAEKTKTTLERANRVLKKVHALDPPGVGGRDLHEILLIQLKKQNNENTSLAQKIVSDHLSHLERKQFDQLSRLLQITPQKVKEVCQQIGKLEPKPGRVFYHEKPNFVVPDASVSISPDRDDELVLDINTHYVPNLRINSTYREMIRRKDLDPETKAFLKQKIQAGLDLIKALSQRKSTIQLITEEIMKAQRDFFSKGFSHLKPLRLKDVSERIGIHESTVSRAIQGKYLDTPQGTIPYKSFFSNRLGTSQNGEAESQKSAMERLKNLIANENKQKPLSDAKLVQLLNEEGIKVARRTVAKYRDVLKILPAYLRKN